MFAVGYEICLIILMPIPVSMIIMGKIFEFVLRTEHVNLALKPTYVYLFQLTAPFRLRDVQLTTSLRKPLLSVVWFEN